MQDQRPSRFETTGRITYSRYELWWNKNELEEERLRLSSLPPAKLNPDVIDRWRKQQIKDIDARIEWLRRRAAWEQRKLKENAQ